MQEKLGTDSPSKQQIEEYVKETNQIIVFNGNKVEVYNESEVSLFN
jgi:outer membrane lipoprotein-sorting protein